MIDRLLEWARANPELLQGAMILGLVVSIGSVVLVPLLVARLPADYFAHTEPAPMPWAEQRPALRALWRVLRNLAGLALLLLGIAMLVLPGQGLLTILAGLILLEFPGKRRTERALVRRPVVRRALDWIRERAGRDPLEPPEAPGG